MKRAALILVVAGCGSGKHKPSDAAAIVAKPVDAAPAPALTWKVDGERQAMVSAFAVPAGDDLVVELSTWPRTCADRYTIRADGHRLVLILRKTLRPDGTWAWTDFGRYAEGGNLVGGEPLASAAIDATHARFDLAETFEDPDGGAPTELTGTVDAVVCAPDDDPSPPDARPPQPDAYLEVAGQRAPIVSAAYWPSQEHGWRVTVASDVVGCTEAEGTVDDPITPWPDLALELRSAGAAAKAEISGAWLDTWHGGDGAGLTISPEQPEGKGEVTLTLAGNAVLGGYAVAWAGTVKAITFP